MKRAYLMEMTIFRDYVKQLMGVGFFVALFVSAGMGSIVAAPAILTMMFSLMGTMAAATYDEQNNWGLYRLAMPFNRHEVVLARYGAIATIGLIGMAAGIIGALALSAIATVAPLPGELTAALGLTQDNVQAMVFSCALCAIVGSGVAAIETPIYLRFGQTKATQWIPMISVLLFISPAIILGATGGLGNFAGIADTIRGIFAFIETRVGAAGSVVVALAVSAIILGISAAISLALYDRREL